MSKKKKTKKPVDKKTGAAPAPKVISGPSDMREKINVLALIEALEQHVQGEKEMTATQVSAALALLKKTLPDISEPARKPQPDGETARVHEDALQELE